MKTKISTNVSGTIMEAFLGIQAGAAGKEKAHETAKKAQEDAAKEKDRADKAVRLLEPEKVKQFAASR